MAKPLILASGSPRRKEILEMLQFPFSVEVPSAFVELTGKKQPDPTILVLLNAEGKAREVAKKHPESLILGVDTVVYLDGQILEKPRDQEDAKRMLALLQGQKHEVFTGHFLFDPAKNRGLSALDQSTVEFLPMSGEEIEAYIATGEPLDKAGAYAIQGLGAQFIKRLEGDFFGVMGLSVAKLTRLLHGMD